MPLIECYDGAVVFDHPSVLANRLSRGELDAGLVPIFEALGARHYSAVDEVAIACDGPVFSVFLAHRGPLKEVRSIALDPGSLTSVHLLKVILAEAHQMDPEYLDAMDSLEAGDAQLLIGNQAIEFRIANPEGYQFLDLGEEWKRLTGLPFVFAVWMLRPGLSNEPEIAAGFRALQRSGLAQIPNIVARESFQDAGFRHRYLTDHIRFGLGEREKQGIERFRELLVKHRLVPGGTTGVRYV